MLFYLRQNIKSSSPRNLTMCLIVTLNFHEQEKERQAARQHMICLLNAQALKTSFKANQ
jgi:hypothetical protein